MENELKKLAAAMRDMSDMVGDHHWQAAKAIEELGVLRAELDRLTDAQRLLSQLREELAQRDAQITRLNRTIYAGVENELALRARLTALESQQAASLDAAAERNAMQRQRDDAKKLLVRECDDADELVRLLGLAPEAVRTDGGFLNLAAVRSMLAASVGGEREAFEAAFSDTFFSACFEQEADGTYAGRGLQGAWMGWQKRAALSPAGGGVVMPAELTDDMLSAMKAELDKSPVTWCRYKAAYRSMIAVARLNAKPQANSQEADK